MNINTCFDYLTLGNKSSACNISLQRTLAFLANAAIWLIVGLSPYTAAHAALEVRTIADRKPLDTTPIEAYVTVTDTNGLPVTGLSISNFNLKEDGSAQSITGFSLPPISGSAVVSLVFVMDYSGSVSSYETDIEAAVVDMINNHMQADDMGAVVKFNSAVNPLTPAGFTANKADLEAAVLMPFAPTASGTSLFDAIMVALNGIESASLPAGPRAIVLLSDGRDNSSTTTLDELIAQINTTSVPLFTVVFGNTTNTTRIDKITDASHGQTFETADPAAIQGIYQSIINQLQNEYLLTYSSAITDSNTHSLNVGVDVPNAQNNTITFRRSSVTGGSSASGGGGGGVASIDCLVLFGLCAVIMHRRRSDRLQCRAVSG